ncbi:hypothetical protein AVMA1855_17725 [Acidovorax sp. SUPP1855]|uniref:hypothetical protein n=1 Tax=Acidovorax sp. SUPP1855 TaxID=431774 RepID=UPI0023DE5546|nr:hypothetical protein [Acidovorax sp. SUPP1855]GKS86019.1 hypothetical protein AVMA1855_17725 [Acidovorax sp. SUPP1855]
MQERRGRDGHRRQQGHGEGRGADAGPVGQLVAHDPQPHAEQEDDQQPGARHVLGPQPQHAGQGQGLNECQGERDVNGHPAL